MGRLLKRGAGPGLGLVLLLLSSNVSVGAPLPPPTRGQEPSWYPLLGDTVLWAGFENGPEWINTSLMCADVMWERDSVEGQVVWRCGSRGGGYGDNWLQYLTTGPIALPGGGPLLLSLDVRYVVEEPAEAGDPDRMDGFDGMNLRVSPDGGRRWLLLEPTHQSYHAQRISGFEQLEGERLSAGWCGTSREWKRVEVDVSGYAGMRVLFRVACVSDQWGSGREYEGWMVRRFVVADSSGVIWQEEGDGLMTPSVLAARADGGWRLTDSDYHGPFQSYHCPWSPSARWALESPYIDLRGFRRASLSYWYVVDLPDQDGEGDGEWDDFYTVEVSADSGETWHLLLCDADSLKPGQGWCRRSASDAARVGGNLLLDKWTGQVLKVRFVLRTDGDDQEGGGLWIDDVAVEGARGSSLPGEVLLTELAFLDSGWALEVENRMTAPVSLGGWILEWDGVEHTLLATTVVPPGGWFVLGPREVGEVAVDPCRGVVRLLEPLERWQMDALVYGSADAAPSAPVGASVARVDAPGLGEARQWELDFSPTLGCENDAPEPALGSGPLYVVEVGWDPDGGDSMFVEVMNTSEDETVCAKGWYVGVGPRVRVLTGDLPPGAVDAWWVQGGCEASHRCGVAYLWSDEGRRVDQVAWASLPSASVSRGMPRGEQRRTPTAGEGAAPEEFVACTPTPGRHNRCLLPPHGGLEASWVTDGVRLRWPPVRDCVEGFNLYRAAAEMPRTGPLNGDKPTGALEFLDLDAHDDTSYVYWLEVVYASDDRYLTEGVELGVRQQAPTSVVLVRVDPNPFEERTLVTLEVREAVEVEVVIYGPLGRAVRSLVSMSGKRKPGTWRFGWDGTDEIGTRVPPGLYFCRAWWPEGSTSVKMLLLPPGRAP